MTYFCVAAALGCGWSGGAADTGQQRGKINVPRYGDLNNHTTVWEVSCKYGQFKFKIYTNLRPFRSI